MTSLKFRVREFHVVFLIDNSREFIDAEEFFHDMDAVGIDCKTDRFARFRGGSALNFYLVSAALDEYLIVDALEDDGGDFSL